jgi:hypothetical protein
LIGVIVPGHSSLDRVLGDGLKYPDSFHPTHPGWIGRQQARTVERLASSSWPEESRGGAQEEKVGEPLDGRVVLE